jgi:hypothetical protein
MVYADLKYKDENSWTNNVHLKKGEEKQEGKNSSFFSVYASGKGMGTRKGGMRV